MPTTLVVRGEGMSRQPNRSASTHTRVPGARPRDPPHLNPPNPTKHPPASRIGSTRPNTPLDKNCPLRDADMGGSGGLPVRVELT
jgi:hypothetical protein